MDKITLIREYILDKIESGEYQPGGRIPAARELCQETGASFVMVMNAVSSLERDGVLYCEPRQGTYVRPNYRERVVGNHLVLFSQALPWLGEFRPKLQQKLPAIRLCKTFENGMFELRNTSYLQMHRNEYLDLSEIWRKVAADKDLFFSRPFKGFYDSAGGLFGIPFIFSPRAVYYKKSALQKAGLAEPQSNWSIDDFFRYLEVIAAKCPGEPLINYADGIFFWLSFVFRSGGRFFDSDNKLCFNTPEVLRALSAVRRIRQIANAVPFDPARRRNLNENIVFNIDARQIKCYFKHCNFDDFGVVSMPHFTGGSAVMAQATDLLCVRKECADPALAAEWIAFMLSEEIQDFIGSEEYGIPIRKSSAMKSINGEDPRDTIFLNEMNYMSTAFDFDTVAVGQTVQQGIGQIIRSDKDMATQLQRLYTAIETFLDIEQGKL